MKYIAIIGDVKSSKAKYAPLDLFNKMNHGVNQINNFYEKHIAKIFGVTKGDEFQGLLHLNSPVCEIVDYIRSLFEDIDFRIGIGIGELETGISDPKSPIGSNGTVWWKANAVIEKIEMNHEKGIQKRTDTMIFGLNNSRVEQMINQVYILMYNQKESWTKQQKHIFYQLILQYRYKIDFKQIDAARQLDLDHKYLNKVLKAINYYDYIGTMNAIQSYIQGEDI